MSNTQHEAAQRHRRASSGGPPDRRGEGPPAATLKREGSQGTSCKSPYSQHGGGGYTRRW